MQNILTLTPIPHKERTELMLWILTGKKENFAAKGDNEN
jgi:hypothetical protein